MLTLRQEADSYHDVMDALNGQIDQFNMRVTGDTVWVPVVIALRDETDQLRGGIVGYIWGGWMYIDVLFLDEDVRGEGWGSKLLQSAEATARSSGCHNIRLETYSFQAQPFYEKQGFTVFATIEDFPPGHTYYFMRKSLP